MALIKQINLTNGITVNYHRIVSVNNITNHSSVIEIASYTDKSKRAEEQNAVQNNQPMNVFIHSEYLSKEYSPNLNVDSAYLYLKTLDKFSGSTDDI